MKVGEIRVPSAGRTAIELGGIVEAVVGHETSSSSAGAGRLANP